MDENNPVNQGGVEAPPQPAQPSQPVQQPAPPQPVPPIPPEPAPPATGKSKMILWLGLGLLLLALVGVGAYYIGSRRATPSPTPTPSPVAVPSPTSDPTADWKTYSSEGMSFIFKYPKDIQLREEEGSIVITKWGPTQKPETEFYDGISLRFSMHTLKEKQTLDNLVKSSIEQSKENADIIKEQEAIIVNTLSGYTYIARGLGTHRYIFLQSPVTEDRAVEIIDSTSDPTEEGFQQIVDQILSTFKFIEAVPEASPTSTSSE